MGGVIGHIVVFIEVDPVLKSQVGVVDFYVMRYQVWV